MTCRGCGPSPDPEQDREHNDWCPDNPRRAHRSTHYTLDQVRVMLHIALTDRTPEWTSRTVDERVEALLAMFTLPMKGTP